MTLPEAKAGQRLFPSRGAIFQWEFRSASASPHLLGRPTFRSRQIFATHSPSWIVQKSQLHMRLSFRDWQRQWIKASAEQRTTTVGLRQLS